MLRSTKKTLKWLKRLVIGAVVLLCLLLVALYFLAPGMILHPYKANWDRTPADFGLPADTLTIRSFDGSLLRGYWIRHDTAAQRPVILMLHGVGNCKERWLPVSQWLWAEGFSTVVMDSRAHGQSGGACCSYGFFEKRDVSIILDSLFARDSNLYIGVWGHSLGGAIALQSLGHDPRFRFGVVESTFADFRDIVYDYQYRLFKVASKRFADNAIERAAATGGFDPDSIKPYLAAERIRCPMFVAHGTADERIKFEYGKKNFEHLASTDKLFYPVAGGDHNHLSAYGGQEYANALMRFLNRMRP
jgi:uncharacterized protein